MEADVDAALGRHQFAVAHAGAQQAVDPVAPVVDQPVRVDAGAAQPIRVGHHRDRRLDHRDRVAVGEGDGGVGEGGHQRSELLGMLRRLEHPGPRAAQKRQRLQDFLQVGVVAGVVQAEIEVAPARNAGVPLEDVAGHVEVEQLDLLLDGLGEAVVHRRHVRGAGHQRLVLGLDPGVAGIDAEHVGSLPEGGNRILALPVRQCPPPRVRGDQVHQMCRPRAGHADHDQRPLDRDRRRSRDSA